MSEGKYQLSSVRPVPKGATGDDFHEIQVTPLVIPDQYHLNLLYDFRLAWLATSYFRRRIRPLG